MCVCRFSSIEFITARSTLFPVCFTSYIYPFSLPVLQKVCPPASKCPPVFDLKTRTSKTEKASTSGAYDRCIVHMEFPLYFS